LEHWGEEEIQKRAETLADIAINVWPKPELSLDVLVRYRTSEVEIETQEPTPEEIEERFKGDRLELFQLLQDQILGLDPSIHEEWKRIYVAFKSTTNVVDVMPRKRGLRLIMNLPFGQLNDPQHVCEDITGTNHWGNGDVKLHFTSPDQLEYIMFLIRQSIEYNRKTTK
jgi:predicted transport protein